jgi:hypothetical protein
MKAICMASLLLILACMMQVIAMPMNEGSHPFHFHEWIPEYHDQATSSQGYSANQFAHIFAPPQSDLAPEVATYYPPPSPSDWSLGHGRAEQVYIEPPSHDIKGTSNARGKWKHGNPSKAVLAQFKEDKLLPWYETIPFDKQILYDEFLTEFMRLRNLKYSSNNKGKHFRRLKEPIRKEIEALQVIDAQTGGQALLNLAQHYHNNPGVSTSLDVTYRNVEMMQWLTSLALVHVAL